MVAGAGVVAREASCRVVGAMCIGLGITSNYLAELYSIIIGLEWAAPWGFRKILIRLDSSSVIRALEDDSLPWFAQQQWFVVRSLFDSIRFVHTYREANFAADKMAKRGCLLENGVRMYYVGFLVFLSSIEWTNVTYYRFK
ncbi:uncharacterized protein LOC113279027 [Papaver somniferum]|uniref:uncharacterized protein LOC113279027 n=1 Tax=Papaver somniferum TaxID=3469 RepID=UPI000E704A3C|nr:uncharacterized protein LOC113279027 [Papaver somniferum]